jgi:putative glutamine amidotransferase
MSKELRKVLIGLSPRILRDVPATLGLRGKTLQYLEQSMAHCAMRAGAVVFMIPTVERSTPINRWEVETADYVSALDGLILQGGADIDPQLYGERPGSHVGPTDIVRDRFELELLRAFAAANKPVLGVCRGMQLVNVTYGGTLHQDLLSAGIGQHPHRVAELYDEHTHEIEFVKGGWLQSIYDDCTRARVTSIHHQGIKELGAKLVVEAHSADGIIECVRDPDLNFMVGVQWHPEFHDERSPPLLPAEPLLEAFLSAAGERRARDSTRLCQLND